MELKEFISSTLTQIAEGVRDAQSHYSEIGGVVNPGNLKSVEGTSIMYGIVDPNYLSVHLLSNVHFEVTLATEDKSSNSGGIGVFLSAVSLGGKSSDSDSKTSLNKVTFDVTVSLPAQN